MKEQIHLPCSWGFYVGVDWTNIWLISSSSQVIGIHEMMGCIQRRVNHLTQQCSAHKEFALKKQQLTASVEGYLQKVVS